MLPVAGGSFDQPAQLLADMRHVHAIVSHAEQAAEQKRARAASRKGRR